MCVGNEILDSGLTYVLSGSNQLSVAVDFRRGDRGDNQRCDLPETIL